MTRITVFGGAGEIGGNQILLEDPGGTVLLDFGKSFGRYGRYFHGFGAPASARGLHDHLLLGLIPPLQGLYREDLLPPEWSPWESLKGRRTARPDAILLTHAHLDHCGCLPYVDPAIAVVMSPSTAMVLKHLQDWGSPHLDGEFRYVRRRVLKHGALTTARTRQEGQRLLRQAQILPAEPWAAVADLWAEAPDTLPWAAPGAFRSDRVCGLQVRWWPVDHSMTGSGAFAVWTEAGWVVYTGDLRSHGRQANLTEAFIRAAAELEPAVLITEGTNTHAGVSPTEADVRDRILAAVRQEPGLVVVNFAARNLDRLLTMYEVARATGRQLLITEREADFLRGQRPLQPEIPDPDGDPYVCTYYRPRPADDEWHRFWRRPGRRALGGCGSDRYLRAHPEEYLVCFGLTEMVELLGMQVRRGGLLIYSNHRPYNAEQAGDLGRLLAWAELLELRTLGFAEPGYHASGHLGETALGDMVRAIDPKLVIPVHTATPEFFTGGDRHRVSVPVAGQPLEI